MRVVRPVALLLLIAAMVFTPSAGASPEPVTFACALRFQLKTDEAYGQPLSRWLSELFALARLDVRYAQWDDGERASFDLWMGEHRAFTLSLQTQGGATQLDGNLLDAPALLGSVAESGARHALDVTASALFPDGSASFSARFGADELRRALVSLMDTLLRGAEEAKDAALGELCDACAGVAFALSEPLVNATDDLSLTVHVRYIDEAATACLVGEERATAPEANLLERCILSVVRAIAACDPPRDAS